MKELRYRIQILIPIIHKIHVSSELWFYLSVLLTESVATRFFFKEIGFIADGWLQRVHNLSSVTTVPVTSYIEVIQNVDLYLFNGGE